MYKPLQIFWSLAVFEACKAELDSTQALILAEVGELASKLDGWFFHVITSPSGVLLRCDGEPETDAWRVHVRLAEYAGNYPDTIKTPANEKYAEFWELQKYVPR